MIAPLCDAVTGLDSSRAILAELERTNLFVVPLDDERRWYRYHHLFADLLRRRLEQERPGESAILHRRASIWYADRGWIVEAVGHALIAGDVDWIEHLVTGHALAVIYHGELATVIRWLEALPDDVVRSHPRLSVTYAWALAYAGRFDGIESRLQDAENELAFADELSGTSIAGRAEGQPLTGHIAAIRAYVAALNGNTFRAVGLAQEALSRLPGTQASVRGWASLVLGCALRSQGDLTAASRALAEALAASRIAGYIHLQVDVLWEQAVLQLWQGRLHEVMHTCEFVLRDFAGSDLCGGRKLPVMGYVTGLMSHVLYEWNDLQPAVHYAREGLRLCRRWEQADALVQGYFYLARALHAVAEMEGALEALRQARQVARGLGPWYVITAGAHEARIRLAHGDVGSAIRWMEESGLSADDQPEIEYGIAYGVLARVLMAQGRLDEGLALLARLLKRAESAGAGGTVISVLVLQALALQKRGEGDRALVALTRALTLAEPEGYVRVFIGEGAPMEKLLQQAAAQGIGGVYVGELLGALRRESSDNRRTMALATSRLAEPLSDRELEVLQLLPTHLSGPEIAQELCIAVNTVRSHIKSLYGKLDVHSRRQAVARAQDLGLL